MKGTDVFKSALSNIDGAFTKECLYEKCIQSGNWNVKNGGIDQTFSVYVKYYTKKGLIIKKNNLYYVDTQKLREEMNNTNRKVFKEKNSEKSAKTKKIKVKINKISDFSSQDALKFLIYTIKTFEQFGNSDHYSEGHSLTEYMNLTDPIFIPQNGLDDISYTFKRMAYHVQNSKLGGTINFIKNINGISAYTHNFNVQEFLTDIEPDTSEEKLKSNLDKLSLAIGKTTRNFYDEKSDVMRYYKALKSIAKYLNNNVFRTNNDIINDLTPDVNNYRKIVTDFREKIENGFRVALIFDFLKEYNPNFDYPKPDLHICRTLLFLLNEENVMRPFDGDRYSKVNEMSIDPLDAVQWFVDLMRLINEGYRNIGGTKNLRCYGLDKMIYVICSGVWYLTSVKRHNLYTALYLQACIDKTFRNISLDSPQEKSDAIRLIDTYFNG